MPGTDPTNRGQVPPPQGTPIAGQGIPQGAIPQGQPLQGQIPQQATPGVSPTPPPGQPIPTAAPQPQPVVRPQAAVAGQPVPAGSATSPAGARPIPVQRPGTLVATTPRDDEDEPAEELTTVALNHAPPWLVSTVFHMIVLIALWLIVFVIEKPRKIQLISEMDPEEEKWAEDLGEQLELNAPGFDNQTDPDPAQVLNDLPEVLDPIAEPPNIPPMDFVGTALVTDIDSPQIGLSLNGRNLGSRNGLLGKYGGNRLTEAAVEAGLKWLARNQNSREGYWSLMGPFSSGVGEQDENRVAATAMALLAFQGHNETPTRGKYKTNVKKGWDWLLKQQDQKTGSFYSGDEGAMNHRFYTQGQCAIAICELYAMTKDAKYREPAQLAIKYLLDTQSPQGGWKYSANADSDTSVTGWIVMALQSARMGGLEVPQEAFDKISKFLESVAKDGGTRYAYMKDESTTRRAMTAEALLCRQYLGWARDDERLISGADYLIRDANLVDFQRGRDVYYWYYATQVLHHMERHHWDTWNKIMRQALPTEQVRSGREAGSWDPDRPTRDQWSAQGGRLYTTCLSIYMLEVYYRHLPLYSNVYHLLRTEQQ